MTEHNPAAEKPSRGKIVAIVAAVLFFCYVLYGTATDEAESEPARPESPSVAKYEAWDACKEAVKEKLRNPEEADFALLSTDISPQDMGWSITGSITAVNDFGVEREIGYSCTVDGFGNAKATVS